MHKSSVIGVALALALLGCDSTPKHSLVGIWVGTYDSNPTTQMFNADKTYKAITDTKETRITQTGTWEASDTQVTIVNGGAKVEGTDPATNMREEAEFYANKGKKSIASLEWSGEDQVLIFTSGGGPPMALARVRSIPSPQSAKGKSGTGQK